jgi:hypothetical protein
LERWSWSWAWGGVLRCQAQLELTLMMCLSDHSTFTSTSALSGRHDGSSPLFFGGLVVF